MRLLEVAIAVFLFNVPFGYWRANVEKLSFQWALAIHLPIPFVIALRFLFGIGFALFTYPLLIGSFFCGQLAGAKMRSWWKKNAMTPPTSCLVFDVLRAAGLTAKGEPR